MNDAWIEMEKNHNKACDHHGIDPAREYVEIEITTEGLIRMTIAGGSFDCMQYLRDNGIELSDPAIEFCG
jgi:hypothetical protein